MTTEDSAVEETTEDASNEQVETETEGTTEGDYAEADESEVDGEEQDETEEDEEPEKYEFTFGNDSFQVSKTDIPRELAEQVQNFSKGVWSDYTRKSQTIAEAAKSLQAREQAVQQMTGLQGEALDTYSKGLSLRQEIEELSKIDVSSLWQTDPDQARRVSDAISAKREAFNETVNKVSQYENAIAHAQSQEVARRADEGKRIIEKRVKGFTEKAGKVIDYVVKEYGIPKSEAESWPLNPPAAEMAYKAMLYDQLKTKTNKKASPKVERLDVKPTKSFKSKSGTAKKDPDKMSVKEWTAWRQAQIRKKSGG